MFYGEYHHILDEKGRFILPARFRQQISRQDVRSMFLTRGLDRCLFLFTDEEWHRQEKRFKALPLTSSEARRFNRLYFSGAVEVEVNPRGRILVPQYLREYANIEKEIVAVGVSNRIEIWAKDSWESFYSGSVDDFERIAEGILDLSGNGNE